MNHLLWCHIMLSMVISLMKLKKTKMTQALICYWYEGAAYQTPSTNNSLESFNLVIKKEETFRERLPLARFLELMLKSVEKWSKEYKNNCRIFNTSTTIELPQWTTGYQWAKTNVNVSSVNSDKVIQYLCPSDLESNISKEEISTVLEMRWNTFDQFKRRAFKVWIVSLPKEAENWMHDCCTCPMFFFKFICKHIIGLAIRLKYVKAPPAAKQVPIGEKRLRGRPRLASRALLID